MENYVVILLLSGVVFLGAFYGYTVEQKIVQIKIENVNEEIQYRNEMKNMKGKFESIKEHNDAFRTKMEDKYYAYRKDIDEAKQVIYTHRPGFYATLSSAISLGQTQRIEFDKIITDVTKSYNNITGVFTVPKDGVYHFSVTILSRSGAVHVELMQNHQVIGRNYARTSYDAATINIVYSCKQGDSVFVRHMEGHGSENIEGQGYAAFSGFSIDLFNGR